MRLALMVRRLVVRHTKIVGYVLAGAVSAPRERGIETMPANATIRKTPRDKALVACCMLIASGLSSARVASAVNVSEFLDFSLRASRGNVVLPGRLYVPPEAAIDLLAPRPLVVYLHGGGSAGSDNLRQLGPDVDLLFAEAKRRGAFLYVPQAPLNWRPRTVTDNVMTMLDRSLSEFNVDGDRLYLTGYSSGGGGTWNMLSRYVDRFAAAVPVAPVSAEPDFNPAKLVGQPIAAFHARNDTVAPVQTTRNVINSILTAANHPLPTYPLAADPHFSFAAPELDFYYIEPAAGDHSVHFAVYNTPQMYDWMFSHTTAVPEPRSFAMLVVGCILLMRRWR